MKKIVLLLAVAFITLGVTSCNSSSDPLFIYSGSLEYGPNGRVVYGYDGTTFVSAAAPFPEITSETDREFVLLYYFTPTGDAPDQKDWGVGATVPISIPTSNVIKLTTLNPVRKGEGMADDPVAYLNKEGGKETVGIVMNFLRIDPVIFWFTKNATEGGTGGTHSKWDFDVEVDEELVPGVKNDTINMRLKHFSNRAEGESINTNNFERFNYAFDLQSVPGRFGFPQRNETGENITYIVKLSYLTYEWPEGGSAPKETEASIKYVTMEWTPGQWTFR